MSNDLLDRTVRSPRSDLITEQLGGRRPTMPASDPELDIDLAIAKTDADRALEESPPDATVRVRRFASGEPSSTPLMPRVTGYEIVEELGRGGMGVVYKAWQHSLKRTVALKMILGGNFVGERDLDRFRAEAMAIARLHHPNLVNIYEIGEHDLLPFYSMEYMEGGSLSRRLNGQPVAPRVAAGLVRALAQAMDYAHKNGIVHRDLKPANILLSGNADTPLDQCSPKITDFGIAKLLNEDSNFTRTGDILGTPNYMAPEQALGKTDLIGPTADVYSLGAILYELLTGRPPFQGDTSADILLRLAKDEPDSPTRYTRGLPRDIVTICMKCLEKDPAKRYASAGALAEDIDRFLRSEPILAIPASILDRVVKWAKRRPTQATMLAMAMGITTLCFILLTMMYAQAVDHSKELRDMLTRQDFLLAEAYLDRGFHLAEEGDVRRGMHWMFRSLEIAEAVEAKHHAPVALTKTIRMNLAAWGECVATTEKMLPHRDWAWDVAFTTDGKYAITASPDKTARIWHAQSGKSAGPALEHAQSVWGLAVHPNGKTIFTITGDRLCSTGLLYVWTRDNEESSEFKLHGEPMAFPHELFRLQLNSKGDRLWVSSFNHGLSYLIAYDAAKAGNGLSLVGMPLAGYHANGSFTEDGETLATIVATDIDEKGAPLGRVQPTTEVQLWDARTGEAIGQPLAHVGPVRSISFSSDGRFLVAGCSLSHTRERGDSSAIYIWEKASRKLLSQTPPLPGRIKTSVFSPNGKMFAVSSYYFVDNHNRPGISVTKGDVQIWVLNSEGKIEALGAPMSAEHVVWTMAFSPDSRMLLAGCENYHAYLWNVTNGKQLQPPIWHEGNCVKVCFSPDGKRALTGSAGGTLNASARLWDVPRFSHVGSPMFHPGTIRSMVWDADGKAAWMGCGKEQFRWNPNTAELLEHFQLPKICVGLHRAPEPGKWYAEFEESEFRQVDPVTRQVSAIPNLPPSLGRHLFYHASSRQFIRYQGIPLGFKVFSLEGKAPSVEHVDKKLGSHMFTLSPDGSIAAAAVSESNVANYVMLFDVYDNFRIIHQTPTQKHRIDSLAFSSDGKTLAMGGADQQIQRLDLASKQFIGTPFLAKGYITWVDFIRNDEILLTRNDHHSLVLWDAATGSRIGPPLQSRSHIELLGVHPKGESILIGTRGNMAMNWRLPQPVQGSLSEIKQWIEAITEMEMQPNDSFHSIDIAKRSKR